MSVETAIRSTLLDRAAVQHTPVSPCHKAPLLGAAARWCSECGHTVPAWDIDHETRAPLTRGAR